MTNDYGFYHLLFPESRDAIFYKFTRISLNYALGDASAFSECDFEDPSICNFVQDKTDDFDWTRKNGSTPSFNTGPSFDHTYANSEGYYLYIETSGRSTNDTARLWTPQYSATNGLCIKWFYHMYGRTVNTLNVYVVDSTDTVGTPVWTKKDNQGSSWLLGKVSFAKFGIYSIMFEGIRGSGYSGDIAIDDVRITNEACLIPVCPLFVEFSMLTLMAAHIVSGLDGRNNGNGAFKEIAKNNRHLYLTMEVTSMIGLIWVE
ncbi:MAM and LDL-receptor class A domain-containing protein 1-like [Anneissia japonica]|uniref:MAM and LDL-receptor class A domain-containing protein 1-like n=1 Tax=Anneissia japonica TaxID=1529436 RepID=UPI001425500D|nr:MAM and LDL-receptor class A domain-containing protein 1-like [Anneissia japonica]